MKTRITALMLACLMLLASCTTDAEKSTLADTTVTTDAETSAETEEKPDVDSLYVSPVYSLKGGFYKNSSSVELTLPENAPSGAYITYTLNGDEPSSKSEKYKSSIKILDGEESTVIRSACFDKNGKAIGRIKTNTYVKTQDGKTNAPYVVSIVTDNENLWGERGIIVNYNNSGKEWERVCHVEIFAKDGQEVISQDAGLRIFGGSSRSLAQKSFRLVARRDGYYDETLYNGNGSFDYAFFPDRKIVSGDGKGDTLARFDRLVLRNGGNDSLLNGGVDGGNITTARDAAANLLAMKYAPDVASQASCFVTVYLNGEYYGVLDMKEDIDDNYVSNVYGIADKDNVTVVKSELDTNRYCTGDHSDDVPCGRFCGAWFYYELDSGSQQALDDYIALCKKIVNGSESEYDALYKELESKIDIQNFIQYTAFNLYICNTDWAHNNLKLRCYSGNDVKDGTYADGKWRFAMRDCDFAFGRYNSDHILPELYTKADADTFDFVLGNYYTGKYVYTDGYADPLYLKGLLAFCLKNDTFRSEFKKYCQTLASDEAESYLKDIFAEQKAVLSELMPSQMERWSEHIKRDYTYRTWIRQMAFMDEWAQKRGSEFLAYMESSLANFE